MVFPPLKATIPRAYQRKLIWKKGFLKSLQNHHMFLLKNRVLPQFWKPLSVNFTFYPHMFTCPGSRSQHTVSAVPWAPLLHIGHQILVDLTFLSSKGWCPPDISWFINHYYSYIPQWNLIFDFLPCAICAIDATCAPTGLALGLVASARKELADAASR